jgi:non-ribosomal peptide synthase protein (TIGR01720 family)
LTAHGKVDRAALPAPGPEGAALPYAAPRTTVEATLAAIWAEVLGCPQVGIHDNFFDLGGDSILSQKVVSRARATGLAISSTELFRSPSIAALAAAVTDVEAPPAEEPPVVGPVALSPIQRWFFDLAIPNRSHWNMSALFELDPRVSLLLLERAATEAVARHDALRMRFQCDNGEWQPWCPAAAGTVPFERFNLSACSDSDQQAAMIRCAGDLHSRLSLSEGPLIRFGFFDLGSSRSPQVLIVVHHLVFDAVSWGVLLDELDAAYARLAGEGPVQLPPKGASVRTWTDRLNEYAESKQLDVALQYWLARPRASTRWKPDFIRGPNEQRSARTLEVRLDAAHTARLRQTRSTFHAEMQELLIAAFVEAFSRRVAPGELLIAVEHHGRRGDLLGDIDLSRTIGWFTAPFPVAFAIVPGERAVQRLKDVKDRFRTASASGFAFQFVRTTVEAEQPEIVFNYMPGFDRSGDQGFLRWVTGDFGCGRCPEAIRPHPLELNIVAAGGELLAHFTYSENWHSRETIACLAEHFIAAAEGLAEAGSSAVPETYSPSDFPMANLQPADLQSIITQVGLREGGWS